MMKINRVNLLCIEREKQPRQVAEELKIDPRRFSKIACGHEKTCWLRKKIADYFGISPYELWPDYEEPKPRGDAPKVERPQVSVLEERKYGSNKRGLTRK